MDIDLKFKFTYPTVYFQTQTYNISSQPTNIYLQTYNISIQVNNIAVQTNTFYLQTANITVQTSNCWIQTNNFSYQTDKSSNMTTLTGHRCKSGKWADTQTHRTEATVPKSLTCPTHRNHPTTTTGPTLLTTE